MGLPIGSGAIESGIRRVINMRLKSNGMFWLSDNAESILQLRCHYISKRLDDRLTEKRVELSRNGKLDWELSPRQNSPRPSANLLSLTNQNKGRSVRNSELHPLRSRLRCRDRLPIIYVGARRVKEDNRTLQIAQAAWPNRCSFFLVFYFTQQDLLARV